MFREVAGVTCDIIYLAHRGCGKVREEVEKDDNMLFGNVHIEIPDCFDSKTRDVVEVLCAILEAIEYGQEYLVTNLTQSLLIQEIVSVTTSFVDEHGHNLDQEQFCHSCEASFVDSNIEKFKELVSRKVTPESYNTKSICVPLDDMRMTVALVFLEEFGYDYKAYLENEMAQRYQPSKHSN